MSNLERERLLSDLELERLLNRSDEPNSRATNDGRVRRKISAWLKNVDDIFLILHKLPQDQIRSVLKPEDIDKLYAIIGEAMRTIDYYPPALDQWRTDLERKETEIFKLQHGAFLKGDLQGISSFSKPLLDLIQRGRTWTEEDLLKELHMDSKDSDAIRITTRQLEELERFNLVIKVPEGWKWAK